jgi:type I restriction enzyme, S subunit
LVAKPATKAAGVPSMPVEGPWELPEGWTWERLEKVASVCDNLRRPINNSERSARISGKSPSELYPYYGATGLVGSIDGYLADGDYVLLGEDGAPFLDRSKSKAYAVNGRFWVNNHAHVLQGTNALHGRFLMHWLNTINYEPYVNGTTRLKLTQATMNAMPVPVPPIEVQNTIVGQIENLFTELDDADAALARARADLSVWRKALLKAAVTGELTADWRAANPPTETGADLLARILADRCTGWAADPKNKGKRYAEPTGPDTTGLPELPEGWVWATTEMLTDGSRGAITIGPFGSDLKTSDYREQGVPLIFVRHIRAGNFSGLRPLFVDGEKAQQLSSHIVKAGDILITKMGDPPGDAALYPQGSPDGVITADCIRWRASSALPTEYLRDWINSTSGSRWILSKTKGVAQQKITLELFRSMPVPVPPVEEAAEAERRLKNIMTSVFDLEDVEGEAATDAATLRQSILAAAFRGDLVQ